ncbi:MAG: alanine--tRNA ligase, partial [Actinobacteria bacterium]|nr:alanine--tRNA ligase [Actinomycetota bacterium]
LEFWNLVFMAYELHPDGTLTDLPKQNIDTGLGLERTARIVQQVPSVYDTDGYQRIMEWVAANSGVAYGDSPDATKAHRVLADHGRGMTFLVGDGVTPSNEGRGYVLRRIIRRAAQHGLRIGMQAPFLAGLADAVIEQMEGAYPELRQHRDEISRVLTAEEERFAETLERGMAIFEDAAAKGEITGDDAFNLQTTYGFPIELTQELARERGLGVNDEEYTALMERHREVSRAGVAGGNAQRAAEFATAAGFRTEFVGYEKTDVLTQLGALEELEEGLFLAKLRESPFYASGGGQVTDAGWIEKDDGTRAELREAYRYDSDQALLFEAVAGSVGGEAADTRLENRAAAGGAGGFAAGDRVRAVVPWSVRYPTMANHTGTHVLHEVLREVLGDHVKQAGSAVRPDKLRFDFTHPAALTAEERAEVEKRINERVFQNMPVRIFETPIEEARKLGAMMLFGEKYGDVVRVVDIGGWSVELCGGTHVRSTAEIGPFAILSEASVGAGARRIEAVTAGEAFAYLHERAREADELREELQRARKAKPQAQADTGYEVADRLDGVIFARTSDLQPGPLRDLSDRIRQQEKADGAIVASVTDDRVHIVVNLREGLGDASAIAKAMGEAVGGRGGGKPTMAQAGGSDAAAIPDAFAVAKQALA